MMKTKTFVCSARIDVRSLATLAKFMQDQDQPFSGPAGIVRSGFELAADIIAKYNPECNFEDFTEAVRFLGSLNIDPLDKKSRARKALRDALMPQAKAVINMNLSREEKIAGFDKKAFMEALKDPDLEDEKP